MSKTRVETINKNTEPRVKTYDRPEDFHPKSLVKVSYSIGCQKSWIIYDTIGFPNL